MTHGDLRDCLITYITQRYDLSLSLLCKYESNAVISNDIHSSRRI